jgi:hypothetical protein
MYTTLEELDTFAEVMTKIIRKGAIPVGLRKFLIPNLLRLRILG